MQTYTEEVKLAELDDSIDWVGDMRKHVSYVETGWLYVVTFSVGGTEEADLSLGGGS